MKVKYIGETIESHLTKDKIYIILEESKKYYEIKDDRCDTSRTSWWYKSRFEVLSEEPEEELDQSKRQSLIEAIVNILVGYFLAVGTQILIFPFFGAKIPIESNFYIGLIFTILSLVRSYTLRRIFNKINRRK